MRNPNRIKVMTELLSEAWNLVPDWRLGQLVSNLQGVGQQDVFYAEDDVWEERLRAFINEYDG